MEYKNYTFKIDIDDLVPPIPGTINELSMYYTRESDPYFYTLFWGNKSIKKVVKIED